MYLILHSCSIMYFMFTYININFILCTMKIHQHKPSITTSFPLIFSASTVLFFYYSILLYFSPKPKGKKKLFSAHPIFLPATNLETFFSSLHEHLLKHCLTPFFLNSFTHFPSCSLPSALKDTASDLDLIHQIHVFSPRNAILTCGLVTGETGNPVVRRSPPQQQQQQHYPREAPFFRQAVAVPTTRPPPAKITTTRNSNGKSRH